MGEWRRERLLEYGHGVAMLGAMWGAKKNDGRALTAMDVFPDPRDLAGPDPDEEGERVLMMFQGMAQEQQRRAAMSYG